MTTKKTAKPLGVIVTKTTTVPTTKGTAPKLGVQRTSPEAEQSKREYRANVAAFEAANVKLPSGEYISKEFYDSLSTDLQAKLNELGVEGFNQFSQEQHDVFVGTNMELPNGDWVDKSFYASLPVELQTKLNELGVEQFNAYLEQQQSEFQTANTKLATGEWISNTFYNSLGDAEKAVLNAQGVEGYNTWVEQQITTATAAQTEWEATHVKSSQGEWVLKTDFDTFTPIMKNIYLTGEGLTALSTEGKTAEEKFALYQRWGIIPYGSEFAGADAAGEPKTYSPEQVKQMNAAAYAAYQTWKEENKDAGVQLGYRVFWLAERHPEVAGSLAYAEYKKVNPEGILGPAAFVSFEKHPEILAYSEYRAQNPEGVLSLKVFQAAVKEPEKFPDLEKYFTAAPTVLKAPPKEMSFTESLATAPERAMGWIGTGVSEANKAIAYAASTYKNIQVPVVPHLWTLEISPGAALTVAAGGLTSAAGMLLSMPAVVARVASHPSYAIEMARGMKDFVGEAPTRVNDPQYWAEAGVMVFMMKGQIKGAAATAVKIPRKGFNVARLVASERGILSRGMKSGGYDVWRIEVPKEFTKLAEELKVLKNDKAVVEEISKIKDPAKQIEAVKAKLTPESQRVFDATLEATKITKSIQVPTEMIREVDFGDISNMPQSVKGEVGTWMEGNAADLHFYGSFADWVQMKGVKDLWRPADLDINIKTGSTLDVMRAAEELANILRRSGEEIRVKETNIQGVRGSAVEILRDGKWEKLIEFHREGGFAEGLPAYLGERPAVSIKVGELEFQTLGEQILNRAEINLRLGVGEGRGLLGPEAAETPWRLKDVYRLQRTLETMADVLEKQGKTTEAAAVRADLAVMQGPKGVAFGLPEGAKSLYTEQDFIELVDEIQKGTLRNGVDVRVTTEVGDLFRRVSPSGKIVGNVVYHATEDIRPYIEAAKSGEFVAGKKLVNGKWEKVSSQDVFTSPDAAFDFMWGKSRGKVFLPKHAGVVAIRLTSENLGAEVTPAFRTMEWTLKNGKKGLVVEDELRLMEGSSIYPTEPTGQSWWNRSASQGTTGETWTVDPWTGSKVPVLWFGTKSAIRAGLGAPDAAQVSVINSLALRATVGDLLHPHLARLTGGWSEGGVSRANMLEFYRDTWEWKGKSKTEIAKIVEERTAERSKEAAAKVSEREKAGEAFLTEEAYSKALTEELAKIGAEETASILREVQGIEGMMERVPQEYYVNLTTLAQNIAAAGAGAETATWDQLKDSDVSMTATIPATDLLFGKEVPDEYKLREDQGLPTDRLTDVDSDDTFGRPKVLDEVEVTPETTLPLEEKYRAVEETPAEIKTVELTEERVPEEERVPVEERALEEERRPEEERGPEEERQPAEERRPAEENRPETGGKGGTPTIVTAKKKVKQVDWTRYDLKGAVTWRQGRRWVTVLPPYTTDKMVWSENPPPGTTKRAVGRGSAAKTIQKFGAIPKRIYLDMGSVDVVISDSQPDPTIKFFDDKPRRRQLRSELNTVGVLE